jgi:hypothetical protein
MFLDDDEDNLPDKPKNLTRYFSISSGAQYGTLQTSPELSRNGPCIIQLTAIQFIGGAAQLNDSGSAFLLKMLRLAKVTAESTPTLDWFRWFAI